MILVSPNDIVIYRSRMNAKIGRNFQTYEPLDFLAAITQHIPNKGVQMVRYYNFYSNKMRGVRRQSQSPDEIALPTWRNLISPSPKRLPSKKWRDLILHVWHTDPLRRPVCQNPMLVIAVIDQREVVEKILRPVCVANATSRHLGACGRESRPWPINPWIHRST